MIELRRRKRYGAGWTKWERWVVFPTREDAEKAEEELDWWRRTHDGETRVVEREPA